MTKSDEQHKENRERLVSIAEAMAVVATEMKAHIEADARAFRLLGEQLVTLNQDVKSLVQSRSFLRGTWFAIVIGATLIGTIAGLIVAWYK